MNIEPLVPYAQIFNAIAMPLIVAGFGWYISRKLEQSRQFADRETLWREYRAAELLKQVNLFQDASDDIINNLGIWGLKSNEKGEPSAEEKSKMNAKFQSGFQRLAFMERKLNLVTYTKGDCCKTISETARKIQLTLTGCLESGNVDFNHIFELYKELLEASKTAHRELLGAK